MVLLPEEEIYRKKVADLLLKTGGKSVGTFDDLFLKEISERGFLLHSKEKIVKGFSTRDIVKITKFIYNNAPQEYDLFVGFYLTRKGIWEKGAWCLEKKSGRIVSVEKNKKYFGFVLHEKEKGIFLEEGGQEVS